MTQVLTRAEYLALKGKLLGVSEWLQVTQERIDAFADVTEDHQFIHVDPQRAAETPFGTTIAHGFLSVSLLPHLLQGIVPHIEGQSMTINYGFDKLRFLSPVRSGAWVRGRFTLLDVIQRTSLILQNILQVEIEIQGEKKPALSAQWVTLTYL